MISRIYGVRSVRHGPGSPEAVWDRKRCASAHSETDKRGSGRSASAACVKHSCKCFHDQPLCKFVMASAASFRMMRNSSSSKSRTILGSVSAAKSGARRSGKFSVRSRTTRSVLNHATLTLSVRTSAPDFSS
jgi:hypothetical protein